MLSRKSLSLLRALLYFGVWTLVGVNRLLASAIYQATVTGKPFPTREIMTTMAAWYGCALVAIPFIRLNRHIPLGRATWRRNIWLHLLASLAFVTAEISLNYALDLWLDKPEPSGFRAYFVIRVCFDLLIYWIVIGISHAFEYNRRLQERELTASQLEARLANSQLEVLRMQLQPHFLFNTLHAISALVHKDPPAADRMIAQLSDLLRMSLEARSGQEVTLGQELTLLDRYLEIMRTRHADRLRVVRAISPDALDVLVPAFVLQPLVENAIRYAIAPRLEGGEIRLSADRDGGALRIRVEDDGPGIAESGNVGAGSSGSTGLGLTNTRERLRMLHGDAAALETRNREGGGLEVSLRVPWRVATAPEPEQAVEARSVDLRPKEQWGR